MAPALKSNCLNDWFRFEMYEGRFFRGEKDTGTLSEDKNGQDNGMAKSNLAGIACCSSFNYIKGSIFRANEYGAVLPP